MYTNITMYTIWGNQVIPENIHTLPLHWQHLGIPGGWGLRAYWIFQRQWGRGVKLFTLPVGGYGHFQGSPSILYVVHLIEETERLSDEKSINNQ